MRRRPFQNRTELLELLAADGLLPAIYFIFSRAGCDAAMRQALRENLDFTTTGQKRQIDARLEETEALLEAADLAVLGWPTLASALRRGIATHHAGMIPAFKELVEELFIEGLIDVVFATETLAVGVNMPARSVVIEELDKFDGNSHVTLTPGEFTQLTGRAGRRGIDNEGFAIVVWQEGLEAGWVGSLASARTFPLKSRFRPDYNMSINLVKRMGLTQAKAILARSFAQYQVDAKLGSSAKMKASLSQQFNLVISFLEQMGYLNLDGDKAVVNSSGVVLSHLHTEQDLLLAEAIRTGVFNALPPAGVAAVASCVVYEPRRDSDGSLGRLPPEPVASAIIALARLDEKLRELESLAGLNFTRPIEAGLSRVTWRWANGARLSQILDTDEFTAGDFFRWMRQTIDVTRQIAKAAAGSELEQTCHDATNLLDRGIVSMAARL
jgi:ATP-dependent RNA helicase HelY